jgi:hypothetical protein
MRGYQAAASYHEENTGLPFQRFILKGDGDFAEVRVLQTPDEWVSLFIHSVFNKLKSTRCPSDGGKDGTICPLCAVDAPRSLRTFIPVRVIGEADLTKVHVIEYGRDNLSEVVSQIEELPEDSDVTHYDFKIKRKGKDKDTTYKWHLVPNSDSELSEAQLALEVPDMEELWPVPELDVLQARAKEFKQAGAVTPTPTGRARF